MSYESLEVWIDFFKVDKNKLLKLKFDSLSKGFSAFLILTLSNRIIESFSASIFLKKYSTIPINF